MPNGYIYHTEAFHYHILSLVAAFMIDMIILIFRGSAMRYISGTFHSPLPGKYIFARHYSLIRGERLADI